MNLEALRQALGASPENVPLLLLAAEAAEAAIEFDEAAGYVDRALRLEPTNVSAQLAKVRNLNLTGRTSEAMVRVESVLQQAPNEAAAWLLRARIALQEGDGRDAQAAYRRALELRPSLADEALRSRIEELLPPRMAAGASGELLEEDDDEGPEDIEGLLAVQARDLNVEFSTRTGVSFADIGGMEGVKEEIRMKIVLPLEKPELFKAYGKKAGGGVLLYGPPGCGKTLLSRATASEVKARFVSVGLHQVLNMYLGESEAALHKIFEVARAGAPTVLFFDEIDALAADRRDLRQSAGRSLINQFLSELDSGSEANEGILILGATNAPWHLDSAFLRPGRFDRVIFVPPPDQPAREDIIRLLAREKPAEKLDAAALAKRTEGFSGADLRAAFDMATEDALREAMKSGGMVPITTASLQKVAKGLKPSTSAWFESAKNYVLYANQSGLYDALAEYLDRRPK